MEGRYEEDGRRETETPQREYAPQDLRSNGGKPETMVDADAEGKGEGEASGCQGIRGETAMGRSDADRCSFHLPSLTQESGLHQVDGKTVS